jgi:hypothetical protein
VTDLATADLSSSESIPQEHVGKFAMSVALAAPSAEVSARWAERADRLAALLTAEWQEEHREMVTINTGKD